MDNTYWEEYIIKTDKGNINVNHKETYDLIKNNTLYNITISNDKITKISS